MNDLTPLARSLRSRATLQERILWRRISRRQLDGFAFRRQHPIGPYIVDFACLEKNLVVELDGGQHAHRRGDDEIRDRWLGTEGYRVFRVWNTDIDQNLEGVLEGLSRALRQS